MKFIPQSIPDIILIEPVIHRDSRGYFFEGYHEQEFHKNGIRDRFVQDNHSSSSKGVIRGLHYQIAPRAQAKLLRVTRGSAFDVAVDIRPHSKTFGKYVSVVLKAETGALLYIPAGFAHGFCSLEDQTEMVYKITDFYSPGHERGIRFDDPALGIPWPAMKHILSEKDQKLPALKEACVS